MGLVSLTVRSLNLPGPSCRGCVSGSERIPEPRCLKHLPGDSDTGDVEAGMAPTVHSSGNSSWFVYTHPTLLAPATHVLHLAPQFPGPSSSTGVTRVAFWVAQGFHLSVGAWSSRGQLVEVHGHVGDGQVFILCKIPRNREFCILSGRQGKDMGRKPKAKGQFARAAKRVITESLALESWGGQGFQRPETQRDSYPEPTSSDWKPVLV